MRKRRVVILGATGSIGTSARQVARDIPDRMEIVGMTAHSNEEALREAGREFPEAKLVMSNGPEGIERLVELASMPGADMVLIAIVGTAGLRPALAAIEAGKDLAIASKEILVMAGEAVMSGAREHGIQVLPVDSEHNAIYQCLEGHAGEHVRRLILTASGGPFRTLPAKDLNHVTVERALKHPTWEMGRKITIDSATLFNKGLEMIEARWLFDVEMPRVDVIIHPQSIIHSMVEFIDGSVLAQLSTTDMCFPIQYAVTWPDRVPNTLKPLDFARLAKLDFEEPRRADFPALDLARWAGDAGGTLPAVLNAANEVAVDAFLQRKCPFPAIWETVEKVMRSHESVAAPSLEAIVEADSWARRRAAEHLS
jgi:1-deoxy-D-xylulose-5-phosphate reductoisomerase